MSKRPVQHTVRLVNMGQNIGIYEDETLLQCAHRNKIHITGACGGRGVCGGCMVKIIAGQGDTFSLDNTKPGSPEQERGLLRACQITVTGDISVEVSARALAPIIRGDIHTLQEDPALDFSQLVKASPVHPSSCNRSTGLAIDLGTSNIAGSLTDLKSGTRLACLGIENPQSTFGADLISRVNFAIRTPSGSQQLKSVVIQAIKSLTSMLCGESSSTPSEITEISICGNTAMHHLLLGLPVFQLGRAPFVPAICSAINIKAVDLGLDTMPDANVHLLPNIGGFVGGDHVAALLATEHIWNHRTCMVIDIGTNTEISLIHKGSISTASTASGPALEGGNISCGMRASEGAIEKVWLSGDQVMTRVIGGGPPVGLCGSGVLDALNTLRQAGIINHRGYISPGNPNVSANGGLQEFSFAPGITVTQSDVRAILLAKAAIRAGQDMLLQDAGIPEEQLDQILIAGAFGSYIDITSALDIGLLPKIPKERISQVGNAAGTGVRMALVSVELRTKADRLATHCRHIELHSLPSFQKAFIKRIGI